MPRKTPKTIRKTTNPGHMMPNMPPKGMPMMGEAMPPKSMKKKMPKKGMKH